jgi:hypothetical protein
MLKVGSRIEASEIPLKRKQPERGRSLAYEASKKVKYLHRVSLLFLVFAASGIPVWYGIRYGFEAAGEGEVAWQFGFAYATMALFPGALLSITFEVFKRGRKVLTASGAIASVVVLIFSIFNTASLELNHRAEQVAASEKHAQNVADLRSDVQSLTARIGELHASRLPAQVRAEMETQERGIRWHETEGCTDAVNTPQRSYCAIHDSLFSELAASEETARLRLKSEDLSRRIRDMMVKKGPQAGDAEIKIIAQFFGVEKSLAELCRALFRAIAIDVASATLVAFAVGMWPETRRGSPDRNFDVPISHTSVGEDLVSDDCSPSSEIRSDKDKRWNLRKGIAVDRSVGRSYSSDRSATMMIALGSVANDLSGEPIIAGIGVSELGRLQRADLMSGTSLETFVAVKVMHASQVHVLAAAEIYVAYIRWCQPLGYRPLSQKKLGELLSQRGFQKWQHNGRFHYRGICLVGLEYPLSDDGQSSQPRPRSDA